MLRLIKRQFASCAFLLIFPGTILAGPLPSARLLTTNPAPFVGEKLILQLEISHSQLPRQATTIHWPKLDGFSRRELPVAPLMRLFGNGDGSWVETASLEITPLWPGETVLSGGGVTYRQHSVATEDLALTILPLPEFGQPEQFSGLVGELKLTLEELPGEPPQLLLTMNSDMQLSGLSLPQPTLAFGLELLKLSDQSSSDNGRQRRQLRYQLRPMLPWLDQVRFEIATFNPTSRRYQTISATSGHTVRPLLLGCGLALMFVIAGFIIRAWRLRPVSIAELLSALLNEPAAALPRSEVYRKLNENHPQLSTQLQQYWQVEDQLRFSAVASGSRIERREKELELQRRLRKTIDNKGRFPALSGVRNLFKGL